MLLCRGVSHPLIVDRTSGQMHTHSGYPSYLITTKRMLQNFRISSQQPPLCHLWVTASLSSEILHNSIQLCTTYSNLLPKEARHALLWVSQHTTVITQESPCMSLPVKSRWVHRKGFLILNKRTKLCFSVWSLKGYLINDFI